MNTTIMAYLVATLFSIFLLLSLYLVNFIIKSFNKNSCFIHEPFIRNLIELEVFALLPLFNVMFLLVVALTIAVNIG